MVSKEFQTRWADLDPNQHLRHTAYADYATHVRFSYLDEQGFSPQKFGELQIGPVILSEESKYLKEIKMGEVFSITAELLGLSENGSHWCIRHEVLNSSKKLAALLSLSGAWLDLKTRRLTAPPDDLVKVMKNLPRSKDYREILISKS